MGVPYADATNMPMQIAMGVLGLDVALETALANTHDAHEANSATSFLTPTNDDAFSDAQKRAATRLQQHGKVKGTVYVATRRKTK